MTGLQMQIQAPGTVYHCVAWHSSIFASHVHAPRRRDTLHCLQAHAPQERLFLVTIFNAKLWHWHRLQVYIGVAALKASAKSICYTQKSARGLLSSTAPQNRQSAASLLSST